MKHQIVCCNYAKDCQAVLMVHIYFITWLQIKLHFAETIVEFDEPIEFDEPND